METLRPIFQKTQDGDVNAYGIIVQRFQDMAVGYGYAILGDFHLAEDVAQEAFVEAYQHITKVSSPFAFPGWLRKDPIQALRPIPAPQTVGYGVYGYVGHGCSLKQTAARCRS
jgi:hypothetical protein